MLAASFRVLVACLSAVALYYSFLFARSQSFLLTPSVSTFTAAIKLVPYNADAYVALSQIETDRSSALLKRALTLNSFNPNVWVKLGFAAEFQDHDLVLAEKSYLRAAQINRGFYARSNLANFYFRQQDEAQFKHWLSLALQMNSANPALLFAELWAFSTDGPGNLTLMPDRPEVLLSYADFLLETFRFDDAEPALDRAMKLMSGKEPVSLLAKYVPSIERNVDFFGSCLDRLLAANRYQGAQRLASALFAKRVFPYPAPTPSKPITNGDFRIAAFHHGFDWLFSTPPNMPTGINIDQFLESAKLRLTFSGQQPENCRLIEEYIVLQPNARYRMDWVADSETIPKDVGFTWRLIPIVTNSTAKGPVAAPDSAAMLISPDLLPEHPAAMASNGSAPATIATSASGPASASASWTFTAPAVPLSVLALEYHRSLGTTRPEGDLTLGTVSLTPI